MFSIFGRLSNWLAAIPYALVGLFVRVVVAYPFFFDGQDKVEGTKYVVPFPGHEFTLTLPTTVLEKTFNAFANDYKLPVIPSSFAAYIVSFAEFVLPVLILVGLATRISALGLLIMTLIIQFAVHPDLWWTLHAYWVALLLVLMSRGPGHISLDAFFGLFRRKRVAHMAVPVSRREPELVIPASAE